jgi:formamidopyrimidine-DNA glycosylase
VPELPEVETIRTGLEPHLVGHSFARVEISDSRLTRPHDPREVAAELEGETVAAVERRGKYLVVRFETGRVLLIHLRMTGSLLHAPRVAGADDPYVRAVVRLDNGSDVAYRDVRRFGTWLLLEPGELEPYLAERIGKEPLGTSFTARSLTDRLARRTAPLKAVVLDQRVFAGVGNIYADEALWWARLHPLRPANTLSADELTARFASELPARAPRSGITATRTARRERCSPSSASTAVRASRARAAAIRSRRRAPGAEEPGSARTARSDRRSSAANPTTL